LTRRCSSSRRWKRVPGCRACCAHCMSSFRGKELLAGAQHAPASVSAALRQDG
jgi:hypothetical protein